MIYVLLLTLVILSILTYYLNEKDILAPSFIFAASFTFSSIWAVAYANIWELSSFHRYTYYVIVGGVVIFLLTSLLTKKLFFKKRTANFSELKEIKVDNIVKIICVVFEVITIFLCLNSIVKSVNGSWSNVLGAIKQFDSLSKFSNENIGMEKIPSFFRIITNALSYWYLYIVINNFIINKKIDVLSCCIILLGIITSMTTGGRNAAINILISIPAILFILSRKKSIKKSKMPFKTKIAIILLPIIVLISFPRLTALVGREVKQDNIYYLAIYCGAEIKNLDTYVQENTNTNIIIVRENQTFKHLINWIGPKIGEFEQYKLYLPFRSINGYGLGNVYTTFYAYLMDYGYIGIIWCVALMAFISQFVYERCKRVNLSNSPRIMILVYGYIFSSLVLSFFSNKFYEQNFNKTFIYAIILWMIFNKVFPKIKLNNKESNR